VANHKSALKAHRQTKKHHERNRQARSKLRTALKSMRGAIQAGNSPEAKAALGKTVSLIDKMAGKGIIHDNAAARYKSRLAKRFQKATA
jgi:small subunit ribosomal protein S20